MTDSTVQIIPSGRELDLLIARLTTKGLLASGVVAIIAVVLLVRDDFSTRSIILLAGAVASVAGLIGYIAVVLRTAVAGVARRGLVPMLLTFGGFAPYAFGCYLVFYEGLWGFWRLLDGFTFSSIIAAVLYLIAGYLIVLAIYGISEFGRALTEGRIVVQKSAT